MYNWPRAFAQDGEHMKSGLPVFLPILLLLTGATVATAQDRYAKKSSDPIAPGSTTKYSDLLGLLFTDFSSDDDTATKTIPLRHVSGDHGRVSITGHFDISTFEAATVRSNDGPMVIVEIDITIDNDFEATIYSGEASILAAFRTSPKPWLVDALDIKTDRFTGFRSKKTVLQIGPDQDAVLIVNNHSNSSQNYDMLTAYSVENGRLKAIFDLFIFNSRGCGASFEEEAKFLPQPDPRNDHYRVFVSISFKMLPDDEYCVPRKRGYYRIYHGTYEWDKAARRYRRVGGNLGTLDKINSKGL